MPAKPRTFRTRHRHAQEAHEAIRPTDFARAPEALAGRLDRAAVQLYGLVWNRALASQMASARFDRVRVEIAPEGADTGEIGLATGGSQMVFDGHLRVWGGDEAETAGDGPALPALEEGDPVSAVTARVERHVTRPPPRYTEAGLVRRLPTAPARPPPPSPADAPRPERGPRPCLDAYRPGPSA